MAQTQTNYTRKVEPKKTVQTKENSQEHLVVKAAAWEKQTKKGDQYLSVKVELDADTLKTMLDNDKTSLNFNMFINGFKETDKQPLYRTIDVKE